MITHNLSLADYLAIDALSSGVAFEAITRSPFHADHYRCNQDRSKVADVGTVAHQLLLEGHEDGIALIDADDWRTNLAKAARDEAYACGKTPLLKKQIGDIRKMVDAVRGFVERTELAGVFGTGHAEVTVEWEDGDVRCKARPDYLTDTFHISLKTTKASAEPATWCRRQMAALGYDFQLAFYARGLRANGLNVEHRILLVEQDPPYGASVITMAANKRTIAESMVERAIPLWGSCLEKGEFHGYSTETFWAEATPWELAEAEERELKYLATGVSA